MSPEQLEQFEELVAWMQQKKAQQLTYPLDLPSQKILLAPFTQKITAGAPYTNDGIVTLTLGGVKYSFMTAANP